MKHNKAKLITKKHTRGIYEQNRVSFVFSG